MASKKHLHTQDFQKFWRANPHPFMPRSARPKTCAKCGYGKTNDIHDLQRKS